jgi:hypothetical protein
LKYGSVINKDVSAGLICKNIIISQIAHTILIKAAD